MQALISDLPDSITMRATPWDAKVFDINTSEVYVDIISDNCIDAAIKDLNKLTGVSKPALFYGRVDSNNANAKHVFIKSGFFACETQLQVFNSLSSYRVPKELGSRRMPINEATDLDYKDVCKVAENTFGYSRFHEDPFIHKKLSNLRMRLWCEDMQHNETPLLVSRGKSGEIDSFVFYKKNDDKKIELILGGSVPGKGILTPFFWASFIEYFRDLGYGSIETRISASNISMFNIYLFFQFKIKKTYIDFHKHVNCNLLTVKA